MLKYLNPWRWLMALLFMLFPGIFVQEKIIKMTPKESLDSDLAELEGLTAFSNADESIYEGDFLDDPEDINAFIKGGNEDASEPLSQAAEEVFEDEEYDGQESLQEALTASEDLPRIVADPEMDPDFEGEVELVVDPDGALAPSYIEDDIYPYAIQLEYVGEKRVNVIKAVRTLTGMELKLAKALVDSADFESPIVARYCTHEEAEAACEVFANVGAIAVIE